jgi:hypothetical protein
MSEHDQPLPQPDRKRTLTDDDIVVERVSRQTGPRPEYHDATTAGGSKGESEPAHDADG